MSKTINYKCLYSELPLTQNYSQSNNPVENFTFFEKYISLMSSRSLEFEDNVLEYFGRYTLLLLASVIPEIV